MGNYELLIKKLDQFIRKYYANKLMRGTLIGVACLLCYFLLITIGEYVFYFPVWLKVSAIMLLLAVGLWALIAWILRPILSMQQLGKIISHEQAATIIGQHFPEVNDKLLNILQLQLHDNQSESRALIEASIQQKSKQIVVLPFGQAVDLKKNKKYLPYLLVPMLVMALILMIAPQIFREATARLMQPTKAFDPPAPFSFHIQNKSFRVPMNGQFVLNLEVKGEKIPQQVFLVMQGERIEMTALNKM